jgi:transposase
MPQRIESIDVSVEELHQLIDSAGEKPLSSEGQRKLKAGVNTLGALAALLEEKDTSLQQLRELLLPVRTSEKTAKVLGNAGGEEPQRKRERKKGHGRKSAAAYAGATKVRVAHPVLKRADRCPECQKGKVYPLEKPRTLVRIIGQAPLQATVYELEALRCNLCGEVFTPPPPAGVGDQKYDATAASMIAVLKYGSGVPFHRMQRLESDLGIPLAAATQWQIVAETALVLEPVWEELIRSSGAGPPVAQR